MKQSVILISFLFLLSCSKEKMKPEVFRPAGCDSTFFTWENNVKPIFNSNCNFSACHATGGAGSYDYTDYYVVAARIKSGVLEYRLDLPDDDEQHMPNKMKLSSCDYFIIKSWIRQGFHEE